MFGLASLGATLTSQFRAGLRPGQHPAGELLKALVAPICLAVVIELKEGARRVHDLVTALGASQPLVSQHLRVLRGAG